MCCCVVPPKCAYVKHCEGAAEKLKFVREYVRKEGETNLSKVEMTRQGHCVGGKACSGVQR